MQWENVYIFISSTFNDMHAERDYLVKKVFPQLSAWCEERKLRLVDIDLRWGVSEADATENKRVVQVCLDRIDACRPFFMCFLGQRRGWVPEKGDINSETYANYSKLAEKYAGSASVTEMEMLHALIDPLHNGIIHMADGSSQTAEPVKHAFFFMREHGYLSSMHNQALRNIYTNEAEADPAKADAELTRWREEIIPQTGRPVYDYSASWQENENTHEIALPLYVPTTAPIGSDIWNTAFRRWAKTWESVGVKVSDNGEIADKTELAKAKAYNESFTRGRLGNFNHDGGNLAEIIIEKLKAAITERFGERTEEAQTPLQHELDQQAQFLQVVSEGFIERSGDFEEITGYLTGGDTKPFALMANAGMGKTSLLAHFIDTYQKKDENESLHYRFVGGSDDSVSIERLLRSLLNELKKTGKITSDIPANSTDMLNELPELLVEAGQNGKTILIIDALNQLETGMSNLSWIPAVLPENIKLIVSFKRGEPETEDYYNQLTQNNTMLLSDVKPFDSMSDREKLVTAYLDRYFKELDEPRIHALIGSDGADNPLFLKIALSELRVFGVHNDLSVMIKNNFGNTPVMAFNAVLARMESDPAYTKLAPSISLPHVFGWLAHSKYGLSVEELTDLLVREKLTDSLTDAQDAVYLILRQLRPYLAKRDGRIDFFYESFKVAAKERYTLSHPYARADMEWHQLLAEYFETLPLEHRHRLMEQAWQYAMAGMGVKLKDLLWDYRFMYARLNEFDIDVLIWDYGNARKAEAELPSSDINTLNLLRDGLRLGAHMLLWEKTQLAEQLWGRMADFDRPEIKALLQQIIHEKKMPWLRPIFSCMSSPSSGLVKTITAHKGLILGVMPALDGRYMVSYGYGEIKVWNIETGICETTIGDLKTLGVGSVAVSPRGDKTVSAENLRLRVWSIKGTCLRQIELHPDHEHPNPTCVAFLSDDKIVVGETSKTLAIIDLETGECLRKMPGTKRDIRKIAVFENLAVCGFTGMPYENIDQYTIFIMNTDTGEVYKTFERQYGGNRNWDNLFDVKYSKDGKLLAFGGAFDTKSTGKLLVLEVSSGNIVCDVFTRDTPVLSVCISGDGKRVIAGCWDGSIRVFDIESNKCIQTLAGHGGSVQSLAFTPNDKYLLSSSSDGTVRVWDLNNIFDIKAVEKHENAVVSAAFAQSENMWLSSSYSNDRDNQIKPNRGAPNPGSIKLWDARNGSCIKSIMLDGAEDGNCIELSYDGQYAMSGYDYQYDDRGIKLWDLMERPKRERHTLNNSVHPQDFGIVSRDGGGASWTKYPHFSKDGRYAFDIPEEDRKHLYVWDTVKNKMRIIIALNAAGRIRALDMTGHTAFVVIDKTIIVIDVLKRKRISTMEVDLDGLYMERIAVSEDGTKLAFSAFDITGIIDFPSGKRLWTTEHGVSDMLFAAGGNLLFTKFEYDQSTSESWKNGVKLWNVQTGQLLTTFAPEFAISNLAYSEDGSLLMFGDQSGWVCFLRLEKSPVEYKLPQAPNKSPGFFSKLLGKH